MEEKEITYIPYGQDEISQQDLMTSLANGVESYLGSKNWAKKPKYRQAWLKAYQDIINQGLIGASNESGVWRVNHNGNIDMSTKSNIEREMYGDAAYYIQQKMSGITPRSKVEEKKKEDKTKFDNAYFNSGLISYIGNNLYGGKPSDVWNKEWAGLDPENRGIRGTTGRQKEMSNQLQNYLNKIESEKDKYSFEDTPYGSFDEWKKRATRAIAALNNSKWNDEDKASLNALGIDYNEWFNTGADEMVPVNIDGTVKQMTRAEYNALEDKQNAEKVAAEQKTAQEKIAQQKQTVYNNTLFLVPGTNPKMQGYNAQALKEKYGASDKLVQALYNYSQQDIRSLTPDQQSEIHGAYRYLANQPIDSNLLKQIQQSTKYRNVAPNRFKKINGIDNLIWDSIAGHVIQIQTRQQREAQKNAPQDLFKGVQTKAEIQNTPRGEGIELTDADKRDIYATLADLGALVDPEVFSGTALALSASGARTWNSIEQNGIWDTLTDWKTWADWGTGALGGIAFLGDGTSAVKAIRGFGKLMTIPMVWQSLKSIPEAKAAWDKIDLDHPIDSAKKLTPQDYHALSTFLMGLVSGKNYFKGNLAERKVLQESGINTQAATKRREYLNKYGLTRTKASNQETVPTLKVKINDSDKEITLKPEQQKRIQESARKAGNSEEARNKAVKEELQGKEHTTTTGEKIKVDENTKVVVVSPGRYLDKRWVPARLGNTKQLFGTYQQSAVRDESKNFENWLSGRSKWEQWKPWSLGTNSNLRRIHNNIFEKDFDKSGLVSSASGEESPYARKPLQQGEIKESNHIEGLPDKSGAREITYRREVMKRYQNVMNGKFSKKDMQGGKETIQIGDEEVRVYTTTHKNGVPSISISTSKGVNHFKSQEEAKKFIADIVKQQKNNITSGKITKENIQKIGKVLQDLKRKGWLKQGGTINNNLDTVIQDFFKNNNI